MLGRSAMLQALLPLLVLLLAGVLQPGHAQRRSNDGLRRTWSVYDYPDPQSLNQEQQRECGRFSVSAVCDPSHIISRTQADAIDVLINETYLQTRCPCEGCTSINRGYIIRVAVMYSFERLFPESGNSSMAMLRDAQMYSYMLSRKWRMQGLCNETVLILYARSENLLYTLTRRTARIKLTDNLVTSISMIVRHYFDNRDTIAQGILEMIRRYKLVFQDRYDDGNSP